eukprot:Polyplicarium_translucidae@DN2742_c0_g1_i1.p1
MHGCCAVLSLAGDTYPIITSFIDRRSIFRFLSTCATAKEVGFQQDVFAHLGERRSLDTEAVKFRRRSAFGHRGGGQNVVEGWAVEVNNEATEDERKRVARQSKRLIQLFGFFLVVPGGRQGASFICARALSGREANIEDLRDTVVLRDMRSLRLCSKWSAAFSNVYCPELTELRGQFAPDFLARHRATLLRVSVDALTIRAVGPDQFPILDELEVCGVLGDEAAEVVARCFPRKQCLCTGIEVPASLREKLRGTLTLGEQRPQIFSGACKVFTHLQYRIKYDEEEPDYDEPEIPQEATDSMRCRIWNTGFTRDDSFEDVIEMFSPGAISNLRAPCRVIISPTTSLCKMFNAISKSQIRPEQLHISGTVDDESCENGCGAECKALENTSLSCLESLRVIHADSKVCASTEAALQEHGFVREEPKTKCCYCLHVCCEEHAEDLEQVRWRKPVPETLKEQRREAVYSELMREYYADHDLGHDGRPCNEMVSLGAWCSPEAQIDPKCPHFALLERRGTAPQRWWVDGCECRFSWSWESARGASAVSR